MQPTGATRGSYRTPKDLQPGGSPNGYAMAMAPGGNIRSYPNNEQLGYRMA